MNHTRIVDNLSSHVKRAKNLAYLDHPYILGETNSIAVQGRNGITDVFGDALWMVDYSLWAATNVSQCYPYFHTLSLIKPIEHQTPPFPPRPRLPLRLLATNPQQRPTGQNPCPILRSNYGLKNLRPLRRQPHRQHPLNHGY